MNKGDTLYIELAYKVDGEPLKQGDWDEIEFSLGNKQYTLTGGDIIWDIELGCYCVFIDQEDTFNLNNIKDSYQIRLKKGREVVSDKIKPFIIGESISRKVI